MIINDLDGYYIVFDTKNWNTELDTLFFKPNVFCHKVVNSYLSIIFIFISYMKQIARLLYITNTASPLFYK